MEEATRALGFAVSNETPIGGPGGNAAYGSDVVAETLRDLAIPYLAFNPGASFRGLHDSLVNHLQNTRPQMLLCLHEEHAVAIAHGYAKVTGRAMAAAVHSNVGLMHATMAIFNAWCDRMPVIVLGATGPLDADRRRPWIDWIHTATDQGALVRDYVKWDAQPMSPAAAREAVLRGAWLAETAPRALVYINLDAEMQEAPLDAPLPPVKAERYVRPALAGIAAEDRHRVLDMIGRARKPVILAGRVSRSQEAWDDRIAFAEAIGARVIGDLKVAGAFPTTHPLAAGDLRGRMKTRAAAVLAEADLVIALDWVDLSGALRTGFGETDPDVPVVRVTVDHHLHNGWSMDHQAHPAADLTIGCDPDIFCADLLTDLPDPKPRVPDDGPRDPVAPRAPGVLGVADIASALRAATNGSAVTLAHVTLSWDGTFWPIEAPLDYLGSDGGGGIGSGPAHAIGAALALRDMGSGRITVAVCGDGDFVMGVTALWTAIHYGIPLLVVVANNRSFFNDEVHQEAVARRRGRPVENKWIGMRMSEPVIDLAAMAEAQGCWAAGPVGTMADLAATLTDAVAAVRAGRVAVVEVVTDAGYAAELISAITPTISS